MPVSHLRKRNERSNKSSRHQSPPLFDQPLPLTTQDVELLLDLDDNAQERLVLPSSPLEFASSSGARDPPQVSRIPISSPSPSPPIDSRPAFPFAEFSVGTYADEAHESQDHHQEARFRMTGPQMDIATDTMADSDMSPMRGPNPEHAEPVAAHSPFSYGYGHAHGCNTSSSAARLSPSPHLLSSGSGLAQAMASKPTTPPRKRFSAPLPFTRLVGGGGGAAPVVNLGTVGRERGIRGGRDVDASAGHRGEASDSCGDVVWARWDYLRHNSIETQKRLLFIVYTTAFKIWDCTDLESLQEVLSIKTGRSSVDESSVDPEWTGRVVHATVLPEPRRKGAKDPFRGDRPLIGVLMDEMNDERHDGGSVFVMYSLSRHEIVRRAAIADGAVEFEANEEFVVISSVDPPTLFILSSTTLDTLSVIQGTSLLPYLAPVPPIPSDSTGEGTLEAISNAVTGSFNHYYQGSRHYLSKDGSSSHLNSNYLGSSSSHYNNTYNANNSGSPHHALVVNPHEQELAPTLSDPSPEPANRGLITADSHDGYTSQLPRPIFALSHRLLAYASLAPSHSFPHPYSHTHAGAGSSSSPLATQTSPSGNAHPLGLGLPTTQAELGQAALKVGGSMLSGMRTLGGMALSAAKSRVGSSSSGSTSATRETGGGAARFFSRSAPSEGGVGDDESRGRRERRCSSTSSGLSISPGTPGTGATHVLAGAHVPEGGCWVTVVDLAPLLSRRETGKRGPEKVAEFLASKDKHVSVLQFSRDGCTVIVVPRDGQVAQMHQLRPGPTFRHALTGNADNPEERKLKRLSETGSSVATKRESRTPWHVYDLRRGRTSAVVEAVECGDDGRWVGIATRKRTVHVFPVNPYGGKPGQRSHLEGRVRNVDELQHMPTEVSPVVRLRVQKQPGPMQVPLAFTFISPSQSSLPPSLLPTHTQANTMSTSPPLSISSDSSSPPRHTYLSSQRPANFQDILLFDPTDETLSLRRCMLELRSKDRGTIGMGTLSGTSISLPGMGGAGKLSASPSKGGSGNSRTGKSALTDMMDVPMELIGRDNVIATWSLGGRADKGSIKKSLLGLDDGREQGRERAGRADWLAQAELSTFSRSAKLLPRSVYLSHQFSFHTLGEDYHALIRRYQLDISGHKVEVRKEVQISAYPAGSGESFVEGFSSPRDLRNRTLSSSFDEPLASALAGGLEYHHSSGVLPMFPNGIPSTLSFRSSIPIRTMTGLGDGMSEGLGRIRREINRVRSPRLRPRPDSSMSASVPLEFDEEDEDFMSRDALDIPDRDGGSCSRGTSRGGADSGASPSVSTPATSAHPLDDEDVPVGKLDDEHDAWEGWSPEDKAAVDEAERFDDISVVGFLDEEQEQENNRARERKHTLVPASMNVKRIGRARRRDI